MAKGIQWGTAAQFSGLPASGTRGYFDCGNDLRSDIPAGGRSGQKKNPSAFVEPYIKRADLSPNPVEGSDRVDYIQSVISRDNHLFRKVSIKDIRGVAEAGGKGGRCC